MTLPRGSGYVGWAGTGFPSLHRGDLEASGDRRSCPGGAAGSSDLVMRDHLDLAVKSVLPATTRLRLRL